jgi:hypothetical protein
MSHQNLDLLPDVGVLTKPYPGLRSFEVHESHLFFGREGLSEQLITKLAATRFLVVVGTSGSGKSSLVRAGMAPALFGGMMVSAGSNWRVALMRPSNDPIGNLARALSSPEVFGSDVEENAEMQTHIAEATLRRGNLGLVEAVRLALQTACTLARRSAGLLLPGVVIRVQMGAVVAPRHGHTPARPRVLTWQRPWAWPILPEEDEGQIVSSSTPFVCCCVACHEASLPPGMPHQALGAAAGTGAAARERR